ncbi:MAG: hypothetical protein ACUBOA_01250 [Candidatus Loosdrechtia sp.]|uniref:hypothetical protein n=1 Tax=Candidatus Loosdrechtia sp. TaxID=3101272 RepID=UPI003A6B658F|nr:MAG: hypothetical protein QY305_04715 [Candidatus Jettenia sp. AMX2]
MSASIEERVAYLEGKVEEHTTGLRDVKEMFIHIEGKFVLLEQRMLETNKRIDEAKDTLSSRIDEIKDNLSSRIDETNKRIDETNKRIDEAKDTLSSRIEEIKDNLSSRIDETNKRIDEVKNTLSSRVDKLFYVIIATLVSAFGSLIGIIVSNFIR